MNLPPLSLFAYSIPFPLLLPYTTLLFGPLQLFLISNHPVHHSCYMRIFVMAGRSSVMSTASADCGSKSVGAGIRRVESN